MSASLCLCYCYAMHIVYIRIVTVKFVAAVISAIFSQLLLFILSLVFRLNKWIAELNTVRVCLVGWGACRYHYGATKDRLQNAMRA